MNVNVVITIYCQHNWIFLRQKKIISIHYLTGQNRGLSGLKNIWPVIMTGNLLSVICSPEYYTALEKFTASYNKLLWKAKTVLKVLHYYKIRSTTYCRKVLLIPDKKCLCIRCYCTLQACENHTRNPIFHLEQPLDVQQKERIKKDYLLTQIYLSFSLWNSGNCGQLLL